jgi:choline dehydrogenase-like flavoprotein
MAVIDVHELPHGSAIDTDICIVGAGAAALTLAGALGPTNRDVCVLEAGDLKPDEDTQSLCDLDCAGYPVRENYMARARYYGGSCNLWAGRAMKLARSDIEGRPWLGERGTAWPVNYDELDRYYDLAAKVLRLPEDPDGACRGRISGDERDLVENSGFVPNLAIWAKKPMRFGKTYRRLFRDSNFRLYVNANASEIRLDQGGDKVDAIVARSLTGNEITLRARTFVLASGGLENARLMLVSRNIHPDGVGNQHDLVGRYYMDHPRAVFGRVRLNRPVALPTVLGTPLADGKIQLGLGLAEDEQRKRGVVNSYLSLEPELSDIAEARYRSSISILKVLLRRGHAGGRLDWSAMRLGNIKDLIYLLTPKEILPHPVYRALFLMKRRLSRGLSHGPLTIINYCEQLPDSQSRAYLGEVRDRLGMNKLVLDWRIGSEVQESIVELHKVLDKQLRRSGAGVVETAREDSAGVDFTDASHHMGTTRMSTDPKQGVVDADCRVHGVANLYVTGSSVFPMCGNANPTWTIVALALRLADHLKASGGAST